MAPNKGTWKRILDYASFMMTALFAGLGEPKPDMIAASSPQFFTGIAGWLLAFMRRRPFVLEVRDLWPASIDAVGASKHKWVLKFFEKIELFLYRHAQSIVVVTEAFRANLTARGISKNKITVVPHGVDLNHYRPEPKDERLAREHGLNHKFVVGYMGTHGMAHALAAVLDAAEILKNETNVHFLFVGDGAEKDRLVLKARELHLPNVTFLPSCAKEKMPDYWSLASVALTHLKNQEVFKSVIPSKIFEAMAMGIPVLAAVPEGETTRLIREASAGLAVAPENPQEIAQAIRYLRDHPEEVKAMSQNALALVRQYDRTAQAEKMLQVFHKTVKSVL